MPFKPKSCVNSLSDSDAAFVAGFIQGAGFYVSPSLTISIQTNRPDKMEGCYMVASILGLPINESYLSRQFGEKFEYDERPAVFTDGKFRKGGIRFNIGASNFNRLFPDPSKWFGPMAMERLAEVISYKPLSTSECASIARVHRDLKRHNKPVPPSKKGTGNRQKGYKAFKGL